MLRGIVVGKVNTMRRHGDLVILILIVGGAREGSNAHEQTRTRYSHREPRHLPEEV